MQHRADNCPLIPKTTTEIWLTQNIVIHKMQHILQVTPITDTESVDTQMMNLHKNTTGWYSCMNSTN